MMQRRGFYLRGRVIIDGKLPGRITSPAIWCSAGTSRQNKHPTAEEDTDMADDQNPPAGPDLALGVSPDDFRNDMLLGHVGEQDVLVVRAGSEIFAIDAHCSHYHGPLADGVVADGGIHCPW